MLKFRLLLSLSLSLVLAMIGTAAPAHAAAGTNTLSTGEALKAGQSLWSSDGRYRALLQADGNFVVYGPSGANWSSGTGGAGDGGQVVMQVDGNLVVYTSVMKAVWASSTVPGHGAHLVMQTDGNLVAYDDSMRALWSSLGGRTSVRSDTLGAGQALRSGQSLWSPDGAYRAIMQSDGNFVVYAPSSQAIWSSGTGGTGDGGQAVMQADGNFVIYTASMRATWSSSTAPTSNDVLMMQSDGNLVVYSGSTALWSSKGGRTGAGGSGANGYPDDGALCRWTGLRDGSCSNYDWGYVVSGAWRTLSGRGFGYRNCTDYAAWRKGITWSQINVGGDGNARAWKQGWINRGWSWGTSPRLGAVAWFGSTYGGGYGHVAIVSAVNSDGSVVVNEYNGDMKGNYGTRTLRAEAYLY